MNEPRPDAILIAGPTASGKTGLAVETALRVGGEIINTDSMQVYPSLPTLTAQPSMDERQGVPHHMFGHAPLNEPYSVARWHTDAKLAFEDVRSRDRVPVFVGGTGLYFKAMLEGLAPVPTIDPQIREEVRQRSLIGGSAAMHGELETVDPDTAATVRPTDTQRICRALEVKLSTGRSLLDFRKEAKRDPLLTKHSVQSTVLMPDRAILHERIEARAVTMLENGALDEVKAIIRLNLPADATVMRAIGVPQITAFLNGEIGKVELLQRLQAATRQYAKRQSTFFRGQFGNDWVFRDPHKS
ncbi:tRNA (adenosine(37)-N6)-dimethylallyltransferase MiaA [Ahrensia sp. R2A130]|uniref:tRNA (adenosine(37)-N6)-dimethylallyltransferase MiaA n=1 Tax=Ahrensia sp. R2A130 TaxID=744979 RepID=UPI0001E0BC50|nr:tRNA (adenosine(37)-N6)-dimethylallyltransferase MiaA [Ahrensia sp. R2A130]EFL90770.1 tRNA delta(2)-isopentenylpyrophosphate transferase [Ahrensia sp. R2A130]